MKSGSSGDERVRQLVRDRRVVGLPLLLFLARFEPRLRLSCSSVRSSNCWSPLLCFSLPFCRLWVPLPLLFCSGRGFYPVLVCARPLLACARF